MSWLSSSEEDEDYSSDELEDIEENGFDSDDESMDSFLLDELLRHLVHRRDLLQMMSRNLGLSTGSRKKNQKCKFFMMGHCNREEYCVYSHDFSPSPASSLSTSNNIPISSSSPTSTELEMQKMKKKTIQCKFFTRGGCIKGDTCEFMHTSIVRAPESEIVCPICEENIEASGRKYGLLSQCNHAFCLDCIKQWRQTNDVSTAKTCPICRVQSHYVVPCDVFPNEETKKVIVDSYVKKLSLVPCKYFAQHKTCPFGKNCFYSHKSGKEEELSDEEEDEDLETFSDEEIWFGSDSDLDY